MTYELEPSLGSRHGELASFGLLRVYLCVHPHAIFVVARILGPSVQEVVQVEVRAGLRSLRRSAVCPRVLQG